METRTLTPARHPFTREGLGRAVDAFETVAWRTPTATRFDGRVANAETAPEPTLKALIDDLPGWVTIAVGGFAAAVMGMMLGGALHI